MKGIRPLTWLLCPLTIALFSCTGRHGNGSADTKSAETQPTDPRFQVESRFQEQLSATFDEYLKLKDAFVASDAGAARRAASQARAVLASVDGNLLSGAALNDWNAYRAGMERALDDIASEDDLENQRQLFSDLTESMYESVKAFGLGGEIAFYEYCPMAFDNEGGYWLSDSETIRNPYFGDKMLTCGSVQEKLR
jgi:Cu(I)/Ag(I) efflux system membrane fusion protein